jgi:hypothetical protein
LKRVPFRQGLEPVLEPLRTLEFVGFQIPVLNKTLKFEKKSPEPVLWNSKFVKRVLEQVL